MATANPTSPRKKPAKRGPTKAAALKTLGLIQEDLDTLKLVAHAREEAAKAPIESTPPIPSTVDSAEDNAIKDPVRSFYMRNLGGTTRFRLTRQRNKDAKATELKPRGQRGDLAKLQPEDLDDPELITQVEYGLIEIITEAEAREIIKKQAWNQQQAVHPVMAALRSELGEEYAPGAIKIDQEANSQGIVVAQLNPQGGGAGTLPDLGRRGVDWNAIKSGQTGTAIGGNPHIISDGFADARNKEAMAADAIARRKDIEGPAAGLGGVTTVTVEEARQS